MGALTIGSRLLLLALLFDSVSVLSQTSFPINVVDQNVEARPVLAHHSEQQTINPDQVRELTKAANFGDSGAQVELGLYLAQQNGAAEAQQALQWFQRAATEETPAAMNNLAVLYFEGRGVERDQAAGMRWALRAANHNYAPAELNVGFAYWYGWGVPVNQAEALRWLHKSAKHGLSVAQCALGVLYEVGNGVKPDLRQAIKWYEKAAKQNHPAALNNLAVLYEGGKGVVRDPAKAADYYARAANAGLLLAGTNRARLLLSGTGVRRDPAEACYWLQLAADGDPVAAQYQGRICGSLSASDQENARRKLSAWRQQHDLMPPERPILTASKYPPVFETSVPARNLTNGH
jgi:TPR repeat protein